MIPILQILKQNGGEMSSRRLQRASELELEAFLAELRRLTTEGLIVCGAGIVRLTAEGRK